MEKIMNYLAEHWELIAGPAGILEILLRLIPTKRNLSIIDNIVKVLGVIIKNRRKPSIDDVMASKTKNLVTVDATKHIV